MKPTKSKKEKTVKVGKTICTVQTLREWLESRMDQINEVFYLAHGRTDNNIGRYAELSIILEKINDKRIQEIG